MSAEDPDSAAAFPLHGAVVVEIGHSISAPYAGAILAQMGAEVIKVEQPDGGDPTRGWGPPFAGDTAIAFEAYNHGKSSITIDLKDEAQRAGLERLILERADIVIQNLKPGSIATLGLEAAMLRPKKPDLIYCNLSAFGDFGPLAMKPGYDPLMQAYAGLMSITGEENASPVRVGVSLVDMGAAMWAVIGIVSAMLARQRSGQGAIVDTSLYETALAWMTLPLAAHLASGEPPRRFGSGVGQIVPYQAFPTRDGHLMIAAGTERLFRKLCAVLGRPDWATDERFRTNRGRVMHRAALIDLITAETTAASIDDLIARLDQAGVPNAPLRDAGAVADDAQTRASGMIRTVDGDLQLVGLPFRIDGARPMPSGRGPRLGARAGARS